MLSKPYHQLGFTMWPYFILLLSIGILMWYVFYRFYMGSMRRLILSWNIYTSSIFAFPAGGTAFILGSFSLFFPSPDIRGTLLTMGMGVFLLFGIYLSVRIPDYVYPWWIRIIRDKYPQYQIWDFFHISKIMTYG